MSTTGPTSAGAAPGQVFVRIEVPRGSFLKREGGRIEYVSPLPCPFNYGCVPDLPAADGDALDALVLGPRLALGAEVEARVYAVVRFLDDGRVDDKLVCGLEPTPVDLRNIARFFKFYAVARRALNRARGRAGDTRFLGVERTTTAPFPPLG